jgi:hypothetical protein
MTEILIDPKFMLHPEHKSIFRKVISALKKFPEIKEVMLSAFKPTKYKNAVALANISDPGYATLEFNIKKSPSSNTIHHELYHVVQGLLHPKKRGEFTHSEEIEATLLGQARMRPSEVETNHMAYFYDVPKSKLVKYARYAAEEKEQGNKDFIDATFKKIQKDKAKEPERKSWIGSVFVDKPVAEGTKGKSVKSIKKFLKTNIKPSQQLGTPSEMLNPSIGYYGFAMEDMIKTPKWMNTKSKKKK